MLKKKDGYVDGHDETLDIQPTLMRTCPLTLMRALPTNVPPKNVQKGIRKCPQQMPQRSNIALGHAEKATTPQNPYFCRKLTIQTLEGGRAETSTKRGGN